MARIDFYVLAASGEHSRQHFACRLAEKAYRQKNIVHLKVSDTQSADAVNTLLWTFSDGSFVPHELVAEGTVDRIAPVTIGVNPPNNRTLDLLINLTDTVPDDLSSFPRVAEIVTSDEASKIRSREHFAAYRNAGHTLDTHRM